jgi:hypothetical protein
MWTSYAGAEWVWLKAAHCYPVIELLPQLRTQGGHSEQQVSKVITYVMALPVSPCMGSEVPVPGITGYSEGRSRKWDNGNLRLCRV